MGIDILTCVRKDGAMPFPPIIIIKPANWSTSRNGQAIKCIIAHDTERPSNDSNSISYLQRGGELPDGSDRKVSIHALIEPDGTIYQMVTDYLAANHAGYGTLKIDNIIYSKDAQYNVNQISLGFELEYTKAPYMGIYPEEQLLSMGWWIYQKRVHYGQLPIYRHADVDPKRRTDTRHLSVAEIEHWVTKAEMMLNDIPTVEKPLMYKFIVPQVVYTERTIASRFAGAAHTPVVYQNGMLIPIGDITDDWAWIATGIGFVPLSVLVKV